MPRISGQKIKSADVSMGGVSREMKAPNIASIDSLSRLLRRASKQSPNAIIDAVRAARTTDILFEESLRKAKSRVSAIRRLLLVRKSRGVI